MRQATTLALLLAGILSSGCASNLTCDDPETYQSARESEKVKAPEGLDGLEESREMRIPRASPRDEREPGSPCLDLPPTIQASDSS